MNLKINRWALVFFFVLLASCSHNKAKPESATPLAQASASPTPETMEGILDPLDCSAGRCSTPNTTDYLNKVMMPRILHSHVVRDCFLSQDRATEKELAHEHGSFHFEANLVLEDGHVHMTHLFLSRFTNIPLWTQPCLVEEYEKMSFPPFKDKRVKESSAFGTIDVSWKH